MSKHRIIDCIGPCCENEAYIRQLEAELKNMTRACGIETQLYNASQQSLDVALDVARDAMAERDALREVVESYCSYLEARYDNSESDGAYYEAWQDVKALLEVDK